MVKRRLFDPALLQLRYHGLDFVLGENEIAHDHRHAFADVGEAEPGAEGETGLDRNAGHGDGQVGARKGKLEGAVGLWGSLASEYGLDRGGRRKGRRFLGCRLRFLSTERARGSD